MQLLAALPNRGQCSRGALLAVHVSLPYVFFLKDMHFKHQSNLESIGVGPTDRAGNGL